MARASLALLSISVFLCVAGVAHSEEPPGYIGVKPDEAERVLGADIAARALSNDFTELRRSKIAASLDGVPD
jgi:hypothetical protein